MKTKTSMDVLRPPVLLLLFLTLAVQVTTALADPAVTKIAAGSLHSLFVKSDGSLWAMGDNLYGQLGDGATDNDNYDTNVPEKIVAGNVNTVAAGEWDSLFRESNGSLWAMGHEYGQVGGPDFPAVPTQIVSSQVTTIAAGSQFILYGQYRSPAGPGSLWAMGNNGNGQLGDGTTLSTNVPQEIFSALVGIAVSEVACGYAHSLYIRPGGSLWGMGWNAFGQLGDGSTTDRHSPVEIAFSNVVAVAAGDACSLFVKSDGSLWAMGYNGYGQLGDGTTNDQIVPEEIVSSNVVAIAAGGGHSLFIKSDGSLWAMGYNYRGQLGDGTTNDWHIPIQIVPYAIKNGGFESGDFEGWNTGGNFSWSYVTPKPATYIHSGRYGAQLGPVGAPGYLSQNYLTTPGATYVLSFWLNSLDGETPNEFLVSWNGTTLMDETNLPAAGWTNLQFRITATNSSALLQFGFRNDNSYFGLDDVSVVQDEQPVITGISIAGTNAVLNASNGESGGTYFALTSTNLTLPLNQWTPVATNTLNAWGDFSITATNTANPGAPQQFYILQLQN